MCFMDMAYEYDMPTLQAALKKYPAMKKYTRVNKLLESLKNKELTQPGHKFIDFTITNDTIQQSLSDYVGKGRYTLVDFWASWCGPCIRETKVLKKIREEFEGQNLDILGVAVWDEPQNTEAAIKRHQLPWPQIINAQSIPTDLYGIPAIPCIILFGPDGTILSRDKQGDELIQSVRDALNPQPAEAVK
jgi:thiol-disulfide isomerase/thioredoxin